MVHSSNHALAMHDEKSAVIDSSFSIASVGIATLQMLETLLPTAANEVEWASRDITRNFTVLANHIRAQGPPPPAIVAALSEMVVSLQFQDRNTQIMENVKCILERYRTMLEDVCYKVQSMSTGEFSSGDDIAHAVENILSSIRLSDIRTRYREALAKAQMHSSPAEDESKDKQVGTDNIELF